MQLEFRLRYGGQVVGFERFVRESDGPISTLKGQAAIDGDRQGLMRCQQATVGEPGDWFWVFDHTYYDGLDHDAKEAWTGFVDGNEAKIYANDYLAVGQPGRRVRVFWHADSGAWMTQGDDGFPLVHLHAYCRGGDCRIIEGPINPGKKGGQ